MVYMACEVMVRGAVKKLLTYLLTESCEFNCSMAKIDNVVYMACEVLVRRDRVVSLSGVWRNNAVYMACEVVVMWVRVVSLIGVLQR